MSKQPDNAAQEPMDQQTVAAPEGQNQQMRLSIDDSNATTYYAPTARVWGTAEELVADFAQRLTPTGDNATTMNVEARVIMSPWAAKRLAMALQQAVQRYEQTYGELVVDPRQRAQQSSGSSSRQ